MNFGIPRERFVDERRVALSPSGVRALSELGATVYVEHDAGEPAGWSDAEFEECGGAVVYNADEVFGRSDILVKVLAPTLEESEMMRDDQMLISFLQLALARKEMFENLRERDITAIALENIQKPDGVHPVRRVMGEIAGALAVHVAAQYLTADAGGRGVLMGGVPGVPPASVGIVGAGVVGTTAAEKALDVGAHVILVDQKVNPLRDAIQHFGRRLQTAIINEQNIEKLCKYVDVLITAVLNEDTPTPHVVTREMVKSMKPRSVIVDVAIDQGGSVETSRPTTISNPTFVEENVIHYCVPNMPSNVPRTSTRAFQNQVLPLLKEIYRKGMKRMLRDNPVYCTGLNLYEGEVTRENVARTFHTQWRTIEEVLR
ncbi:alanine dehydrogenase [bacterium]|nr:alanine dehydrogenase [bacterium]